MDHHDYKYVSKLLIDTMEQHNAPGIAANVIINNEIVFSRGLGSSQMSSDQPITPDTIFSIMSIAKSFTATAIMQLVKEKHIDLEAPISTYLPYFQVSNKIWSDKITVKQLLSHTAGFPGDIWIASLQDDNLLNLMREVPAYQEILHKFPDKLLRAIKTREDVTRYFSHINLVTEPGQGWEYCTDAYVIVGDLIEKVTGISWEDYITRNIIDRLDLKRTFTDPDRLAQESGAAHYYTSDKSTIRNVPFPVNPICAPAGFIYSTINDLSVYLIAQMNGQAQSLLDKKYLHMMQDRVAKRTEPHLSYGLGWKITTHAKYKIVEHAGGYPGVASHIAMLPEKGFGVVIFANHDKAAVQKFSEKVIEYFNLAKTARAE